MKYLGYFFKGAFVSCGCVVGSVAGLFLAKEILSAMASKTASEEEASNAEVSD